EMMGRFGAEERPYDEIAKQTHVRFTPNAKDYEERIYDGFEGVTIDRMTVITSKGIDWIKRKVRKK
ncbi:MAG: hypothetical protein LLG05_02450, partial [Porphyromonadaceae bacterium]|nr:hypothetical protein [Porphyromonadaceae bacterium]